MFSFYYLTLKIWSRDGEWEPSISCWKCITITVVLYYVCLLHYYIKLRDSKQHNGCFSSRETLPHYLHVKSWQIRIVKKHTKVSHSLKDTSRHILHTARQSQHDYVLLPSWLQSPSTAQSYDCTPVYYSYDKKKYQIHLKMFKLRTIQT